MSSGPVPVPAIRAGTGTSVSRGSDGAASATTAPAASPPPATPVPPAVVTTDLTKRFRSGQVAVDGLNLSVPAGSVFGFLGPNGSGKTTTIRMLLGLIAPTRGRAELLGEPIGLGGAPVLTRVGALVEGPAFHPYLSGRDNLARLQAGDSGQDPRTARRAAEQALERVGLAAAARKRYRQYSLGMKQRLGLAAALLRPRDLLVLDEPTNGLDPQGTREVRHLVRELAADGSTVVLSSHLLSEIEQVCTHVGIMSAGRMLVQADLAELRTRGAARVQVRTAPDQVARAAAVLEDLGLGEIATGAAAARDGNGDLRPGEEPVSAELGDLGPQEVAAALVGAGIDLMGLAVRERRLEDVFVELTGEGFDVRR